MADIFDSTRRKISKHISKEIAPSVFAEKQAEFQIKVREILTEYLNSPKFKKRAEGFMQWTATENIQKYTRSSEFKKMCIAAAKGMLK